MDNLNELVDEINRIHDHETISATIPRIIEKLEAFKQQLLYEINVTTMEQLKLEDNNLIAVNRETSIIKAKIEIFDKTSVDLSGLWKYLEDKSMINQWFEKCQSENYITFGESELRYDIIVDMVKDFTTRSMKDCIKQLESLNHNYKSPYNFSYVIENLLRSSENGSISKSQVNSLLALIKKELILYKNSKTMNVGQRALVSIYNEKLDLLESINFVSEQETKKLVQIVDRTRIIIKETFGLLEILKSVDWINESHDIFSIINEKGIDSIDDCIDYMEKIKREWIELQVDNETQKVCRLATLRQINVDMKKVKKLKEFKNLIESSWIILGIKNILTNFNSVHRSSEYIAREAYYLTHRLLPKPRIDVPSGFVRVDDVYDDLKKSKHGLLMVFVHIVMYLQHLETLSWNGFQKRKPKKVADYLIRIVYVMRALMSSSLDDNECQEIAYDLADRYLMTKQKISIDRDALEFRFNRYKPEKPNKFVKLLEKLKRNHDKRYAVRDYMEKHLDEMSLSLNRKVFNRGQVIIFRRANDMMKRSLHTLRQMRSDYIDSGERHLIDLLVEQSANEFCYAYETALKLLDKLRSNRRIPFSFNASGLFIKQFDSLGLEVKDQFERKVDSLIEKLQLSIKENEENLESTKDEKTQLKYLTSILNRSHLVPINQLELNEQDELIILKEIIEEYEYTMLVYGSVD